MKAQRAEARAKREAEKAAWQRRGELMVEVRRMALEATKLTIRDRGDKVQLYSTAQLRVMSEALIGPWLVAQAKARIAERNAKHMSNSQSPAPQALPLNETHAHNGSLR
jgi:hypothetical protein